MEITGGLINTDVGFNANQKSVAAIGRIYFGTELFAGVTTKAAFGDGLDDRKQQLGYGFDRAADFLDNPTTPEAAAFLRGDLVI